jgi:predicted nucleic acid-binding protein
VRLLLDTNVILDIILLRQPFANDAIALWRALTGEPPSGTGLVSATTLTDVYYVSRKEQGRERAFQFVQLLLDSIELAVVDMDVLIVAMSWQDADLEDNVQIACAQNMKLDGIVTRDKKGFKHSPVMVYSPGEALSALSSTQTS